MRGVLNDVVEDEDRAAVLRRFAEHLRPAGVVVLDIRAPEATARRYEGGRDVRVEIETERGLLVYESRGRMEGGLIRISERHELRGAGGRVDSASHELTMRPWSEAELRERLAKAGFESVEIAVGRAGRDDDRMLTVARRPG